MVSRSGEGWWLLELVAGPDEPLPLLSWELVPRTSVMRR